MLNLKWNPEAGKPPTLKLLKEASKLVKANTGDHVVIAMAMRPDGVTQDEVMAVLHHPHRNVIKKLLSKRKVKRHFLPNIARSKRIRLTMNQ